MKKIICYSLLLLLFNISCGQRRMQKDVKPFKNLNEIKSYLKKQTEANKFSGTVLIAKNEKFIFHEAFGLAHKGYEVKNNLNTKYNIGSINKMFTQIAIAKLLQEKKLDLSDKAIKYIPELKMKWASKITLKHLLTMSSGLRFYWENPKYTANWTNLRNIEDYLDIIADNELSFEPGTKKQYSNSGYELLGIIIQRVTGTNYYDYIQENVYDKANMNDSGSFESDTDIKNLATGYTNYKYNDNMMDMRGSGASGKGYPYNNNLRHSVKGTAAGGGYSTTKDLFNFCKALKENKLLANEYSEKIFSYFEDGEKRKAMIFAGGSIGINAAVDLNTENGYTIIVLTNYDGIALDILSKLSKTTREVNLSQ